MTRLARTTGNASRTPFESPLETLEAAIAAVPGNDPATSLGAVARALPVPLGLETVGIRLRASDGAGDLYLVAIDGATPREAGRRALEPFSLSYMRSLLALGPEHSLARGLGFRWVGGRWLLEGREPIGSLSAGVRTDRRPGDEEEQLFTEVAKKLSLALRAVDRSTETLERTSALLARQALSEAGPVPNRALDPLRPRERDILILYAEGLAAEEIARLLFISPHTVRTHVKNAFRRLGIHSRGEAARLVHTDEVARIV